MKLPEPAFFSVEDLVRRWEGKVSVDTVRAYLENDQLHLDTLPDGRTLYRDGKGNPFDWNDLYRPKGNVSIMVNLLTDDEVPYSYPVGGGRIAKSYISLSYKSFISIQSVKDFESKYMIFEAEHVSDNPQDKNTHMEKPADIPLYRNPAAKGRGYAPELAAAIDAWEYVVKVNQNPREFRKDLVNYLKREGFSKEAVQRIATVANPYKDGGNPGL